MPRSMAVDHRAGHVAAEAGGEHGVRAGAGAGRGEQVVRFAGDGGVDQLDLARHGGGPGWQAADQHGGAGIGGGGASEGVDSPLAVPRNKGRPARGTPASKPASRAAAHAV